MGHGTSHRYLTNTLSNERQRSAGRLGSHTAISSTEEHMSGIHRLTVRNLDGQRRLTPERRPLIAYYIIHTYTQRFTATESATSLYMIYQVKSRHKSNSALLPNANAAW